jgi:chromosome partitioning protein
MLSTGVSRSLGRSAQFARTKRNQHDLRTPNQLIGSVPTHMFVVALVNQKGGVGKTTVTLGLAGAAASAVVRTLVVDIDPQANATTGMGVWEPKRTIDDALAHERSGSLRDCIVDCGWPDGVAALPDVAPSSPLLASREVQLAIDPVGAQDRLRIAMEGLDADPGYDLVLIDCPPSLGLLTVNGLFAADAALVVTEPGAWATDGVAQILRTVARISDRRRIPLRSAGIAVNRLGRTRDASYWHDQLVAAYPELVHPPVHLRAAVAEAAAQSVPLVALGTRPGALEAAEEFSALLMQVTRQPARTEGAHDAEL